MMKAALGGFLTCVVLFVGGQADEAAVKKEKARLKGTWKITKAENAGGEDDKIKGAVLVLDETGGMELRKEGDETKKAEYKVNPAAKPRELDFIIDNDK